MKTSKKTKMILGISLGAAFLATITASLTWFDNRVNLNPSINGGSAAAYFAYGKGKKDEPYGITTPRHLYNLAWLQYIGKFDSKTTYFELAADIDMSKYSNINALPPIGNSKHPFIGQFTSTIDNGNYHKISNLTISNSYSDFGITPYSVTNTSYTSDNIVGMFGVVGDPTAKTNPDTKINNFYLESPTIKSTSSQALAGIVAGYVNAEISSVGVITPTMSFPTTSQATTSPLKEITFKNKTTKEFNNVSDYSVVGYCEDAYKSSISSSVTTLKNPNIEKLKVPQSTGGSGGGQADWGGSVDMREMYLNLRNVYDNVKLNDSNAINYTKSTTYKKDGTVAKENGKVVIDAWNTTKYTDFRYDLYDSSSNPEFFSFYKDAKKNSKGDITSSYSMIISNQDNDENYMSLTGYAERYIKNGNTITFETGEEINKKKATVFYEVNGTKKVFMKVIWSDGEYVDGKFINGKYIAVPCENIAEATTVFMDRQDDGSYYLSVEINGKPYYLFATFDDKKDNVLYSFTDAKTEKWIFDSDVSAFYQSNFPGVYFTLNSDFTEWGMNLGNQSYSITKDSGTSIITFGYEKNTGFGNINSTWFINDGYLYINENTTGSGNAVRYLGYESKTNSLKIKNDANKAIRYYKTTEGKGKLYYEDSSKDSSTYYYPNYSDNQWKIATTNDLNNVTEFNFTSKEKPSFPFHYGGEDNSSSNTFTADSPFTTPDTYFPLQGTDGVPNSNNTGYVVGGTDYFGDFSGDIRVSLYPAEKLSKSYNNKKLNELYTIDKDGNTINSTSSEQSSPFNSFIKYESSKQQLTDILNKDTNVYGIHFMNGTIGKRSDDTYVTIPSATINGVNYSNYQVPDDCIDFTLKEDGIINFFAGTYYLQPDNNCFFSLYKVERDNDGNITNLKKISKVYQQPSTATYNNKEVTIDDKNYKFKEGKYQLQYEGENEPTWTLMRYSMTSGNWSKIKTTSGSCCFDMSKITSPTDELIKNAVYYFEIPVTQGEYALGSVNELNKNGAYLIYLDIGTNSGVDKDINRTIISEYMETTTTSYTSFMGVCILSAGQTNPTNYNSYCIQLKSAQGDITFTGSTTDKIGTVTTSVKPSGTSTTLDWISVSFKKNEYTVKYKTNETTSVTMESTTKPTQMVTTTKRVTYYDYSSTTKVTNIVQVTTTGEEKSPSVEYYEIDSSGNKTKKDKLFFANLSGHDLAEDDINNLTSNTSYSTEDMLSFEFDTELLGTITITFNGNTKLKDDGYYSIDPGYDIAISGTNVTEDTKITITNITKNSTGTSYTITINNVNTGKQESITITLPASQP